MRFAGTDCPPCLCCSEASCTGLLPAPLLPGCCKGCVGGAGCSVGAACCSSRGLPASRAVRPRHRSARALETAIKPTWSLVHAGDAVQAIRARRKQACFPGFPPCVGIGGLHLTDLNLHCQSMHAVLLQLAPCTLSLSLSLCRAVGLHQRLSLSQLAKLHSDIIASSDRKMGLIKALSKRTSGFGVPEDLREKMMGSSLKRDVQGSTKLKSQKTATDLFYEQNGTSQAAGQPAEDRAYFSKQKSRGSTLLTNWVRAAARSPLTGCPGAELNLASRASTPCCTRLPRRAARRSCSACCWRALR